MILFLFSIHPTDVKILIHRLYTFCYQDFIELYELIHLTDFEIEVNSLHILCYQDFVEMYELIRL